MQFPRKREVTVPELVLVASTRAVLGAGLGLLLSERLSERQRRTAGYLMTAVGLLSTVPLLLQIFGREGRPAARADQSWGWDPASRKAAETRITH
jgi:hypothetical protein